MLPILLMPNPEGNTEQVIIEIMVFVLGFSGLAWSALTPDKRFAKKPVIVMNSDSEDAQTVYEVFSNRDYLPKDASDIDSLLSWCNSKIRRRRRFESR